MQCIFKSHMRENNNLYLNNGIPKPFGTNIFDYGINFSIFSKKATSVVLCLFSKELNITEIPLSKDDNKTGDVWHVFVHDLTPDYLYGYKIDGSTILLDPFAKAVFTLNDGTLLGGFLTKNPFDWEGTKNPQIPTKDLIIYEMHVRGFTIDDSSKVVHKGTFLGIVEKIPYLIELGISAIELMPINIFDQNEYKGINPLNNKILCNYWGYSPLNYFSLHGLYASGRDINSPLLEFKTLVKNLHAHGIEIILDVVFNHTGELDALGPTLSFRGISNSVYYILDPENQYYNFSGCGNTLNCNHPVVIDLILEALRYFVIECHVDGFRFDLASIFNRDEKGEPHKNLKILDMISEDPVLMDTKLIAEPWDAAGFYQVGWFYTAKKRWSEWNGRYRDALRYFLNGLKKDPAKFATRISGSEDLYYKRGPETSINFITSHDGFSLRDLVSYAHKHNLPNGENNEDGLNHNMSNNFGIEGETLDPIILKLREKQMRNFHFTLMISQGVPLIFMGDEYGHTRLGNNNAWCQDNEINWFNWDNLKKNQSFYRFYRKMIAFRKQYSCFRKDTFLQMKDITWHGEKPSFPNFSFGYAFVAFTLIDHASHKKFYIAINANDHEMHLELPLCEEGSRWQFVVNTDNEALKDFIDEKERVAVTETHIKIASHSCILAEAFF